MSGSPSPEWRRRDARRGQIEVIGAALAFAASVPVTKVLLAGISALALSGVLYLSAGVFCAILAGIPRRAAIDGARIHGDTIHGERIHGAEWLWVGGAVLSGAVAAPFLLFLGLRQVSGHVAGLLLNFEAAFTVALGVLLSGERFGRRGWLGALGVLGGALLLSLPHGGAMASPSRWTGIGLVVGACAFWGLDNNLTQRVSMRDARQITAVKGLAGGSISLVLAAAAAGGGFSGWNAPRIAVAIGVGAVSFGLSIALFVRGLRRLGVIQTGMLFALAPGFAAILSWIFLRERIRIDAAAALLLMTAGAFLLVLDRHGHPHEHEAVEHTHEHIHDEHHRHEHDSELANSGPADSEPADSEPHVHAHRHERQRHVHEHLHDIHHRHRH